MVSTWSSFTCTHSNQDRPIDLNYSMDLQITSSSITKRMFVTRIGTSRFLDSPGDQ